MAVVPILLDDVRPLTAADLRTIPDIATLAEKQSIWLRRLDWDSDISKLQALLRTHGIAPLETGGTPGGEPGPTGDRATKSPSLTSLAPPVVTRHFHDREPERQAIADCFRRGRRCALIAIGGSGKTEIAARIAADRATGDGHGVVWLGLAGTSDVDVPQEWLANAFGASVRAESNTEQRCARLRALTAGSSRLLVFDDPESDAQLSDLISSIGSGNDVLITTREQHPSLVRLGVEIIDVPALLPRDATDVLLSLIGISSDVPANRQGWDALAQAVGYHPLSLEVLAGDFVLQDHVDPLVYLQERIANGTWSEGEDTLEQLRKSLAASIARSGAGYDVAFAALGAFEGSAFSADAVARVCAFDSIDAARRFLLELRRRLCVRRQTSGLYSLHPFVAETARHMEAATAGAQSAPVRRHVAYYRELLQAYGGYEWNIAHYPSLIPEERELVRAVDGAAVLAEGGTRDNAFHMKCAELTSLISWYLHWRGHWDLRIRLCERVCAWAEQGLLSRASNAAGVVGNLYVDQGWIHLQRGDIDRAERCASHGQDWLRDSGDLIFATELAGQVALRRQDYVPAINTFESLCNHSSEASRAWLVFLYRLADALQESGDGARGLALLEKLERVDASSTGEQIDDVRGRILYRIALLRHDAGDLSDAIAHAREAAAAFARSGIITPERRSAVTLLADLLNQSGAADECRQFLATVANQAEQEGDFELLNETRQRLAEDQSGSATSSNHPARLADL